MLDYDRLAAHPAAFLSLTGLTPAGFGRLLADLGAVMEAFPAVRVVIDSQEQRVYRPGGPHARQKPYYSGKKKAHTVKTQLGVDPGGVIVSVSPGVPGSVNDVRLLRQTKLLGRLADGEQGMTDRGYEGAENGHPDAPGGHPGRVVRPKKDRKCAPLTDAEKAANRVVSRYRVVVEHAIAQL